VSETPGIGHNSGRESGTAWRTHCWREARRALLPTLPLEIVRLRVARARDLGLDYRTYATIRGNGGPDIVAFLFSTNALRLVRTTDRLAPDRAEKLGDLVACDRLLAAYPPHQPARLAAALAADPGIAFAHCASAPRPFARWADLRAAVRTALDGRPPDAVLLVGDTAPEREWVAAGRLAGYLHADSYFPTP
jgi:hypothetical protein